MSDPALAIAVPFIAAREGFVADPYCDVGDTWSIGYGFTTNADGSPVTADTPPITQEDAYARLQGLVAAVLGVVRGMIYVPVSNNSAAALISFSYNEGTGALRRSTLLRLLNEGASLDVVAQQFSAWVYDKGQFIQGLANRRRMEAELFLTPDT